MIVRVVMVIVSGRIVRVAITVTASAITVPETTVRVGIMGIVLGAIGRRTTVEVVRGRIGLLIVVMIVLVETAIAGGRIVRVATTATASGITVPGMIVRVVIGRVMIVRVVMVIVSGRIVRVAITVTVNGITVPGTTVRVGIMGIVLGAIGRRMTVEVVRGQIGLLIVVMIVRVVMVIAGGRIVRVAITATANEAKRVAANGDETTTRIAASRFHRVLA